MKRSNLLLKTIEDFSNSLQDIKKNNPNLNCSINDFIFNHDELVDILNEIEVNSISYNGMEYNDNKIKNIAKITARLLKMYTTDHLSKLLTRDAFYCLVNTYEDDLTEKNIPFCLVMIDVNKFKLINDTYGHKLGDEVLVFVAETLSKSFRKYGSRNHDIVGRFGGDEFIVALQDCDIEQANVIIERVDKKFNTKFELSNGEKIKISLSYGVAQYNIDYNYHKNIDIADKELYKNKKASQEKTEE